jgi:cell division protein FtsB
MRTLALVLCGLLLLIQYPLWLGKGGWLRVWELDRQVVAQQAANARLRERNTALEGEVGDLKQGLLAIEERARYELGMIRPDEIFVQVAEPGSVPPEGTHRLSEGVRRSSGAAGGRVPAGATQGVAATAGGSPGAAAAGGAAPVSAGTSKRAAAAR